MKFEIHVAQDNEAGLWDQINDSSAHGSPFHTWKWLKIAERHSNSKLVPIIGFRDDEPLGIFPLFFGKKYFVRFVFSPPPRTALLYLGPVLANYDNLRQERKEYFFSEFQSRVDQYITDSLSPGYTYIALPYGLSDPRPFKWSGYSIGQTYDYSTNLNGSIDDVWLRFKPKLRKDIDRAERKGIHAEEGGKKELEIIYDLLVERYREQNRVVKVPKNYLFDLHDTFPQNMKIFVAKSDDQIITGSVEILHRDALLSWIGSPKPKDEKYQSPNEVLTWEIMKYSYEHGLKKNIQLGTAGNERLSKYYSKFNRDLNVRFTAKKTTPVTKIMEIVYCSVLSR